LITKLIGLDFGTTNTHLSLTTGGVKNPRIDDIRIFSENSIQTVLLYSKKTMEPLAFGQLAQQEWVTLSKHERKGLILAANFKPLLGKIPESSVQSRLFLRSVFHYLQEQSIFPKDTVKDISETVVGVPSEAENAYRSELRAILESSGYPRTTLLFEPWGALFYHFYSQDISREELLRGILVIDFGGGTLDCSYLKDFRVRRTWGSNVLGGQLIDDCLFQRFENQNNGISTDVEEEAIESYLRLILFKNIKEKYSNRLSQNFTLPFRETIWVGSTNYGTFEIPDYPGFLDMLREYRISPQLSETLSHLSHFQKVFPSGKTDLLSAIRKTITEGFRDKTTMKDAISLIVLTGGSSRWKFFRDMVAEEFPHTKVLSSADPESTISRGLGAGYSQILLENKVKKDIYRSIDTITQHILDEYTETFSRSSEFCFRQITRVFREHSEPKISQFFDNGGSLSDLEEDLATGMAQVGEKIESIEHEFAVSVREQLKEITNRELYRWFDENKEELLETNAYLIPDNPVIASIEGILVTNIFAKLSTVISVSIGGILTGVYGISGITISALSGPPGWITAFVIGTVIGFASLLGLKEKLTDRIKKTHYAAWFLRLLFPSKKRTVRHLISKQEKAISEKEGEVISLYETNKEKLREALRDLIQKNLLQMNFTDITTLKELSKTNEMEG
jgi:hypothetical protein